MNNEYQEKIREEVNGFFDTATFKADDIDISFRENVFMICLKMNDPKILIGEKGQTLSEIQHLLRLLLRKKMGDDIFIEIDINDYKEKKKRALQDIVKDVADEVVFYKKEKVLPRMNPYERRIVHMALKERNDVQTESIGEGFSRKVVVKPIF
ncbi:MAG: KH domain-containing protein [Candidatus Nealsonbacteria bacterium]|nr:KH domain-containing protein [Candidatus Nealsonbacteria bacterium]